MGHTEQKTAERLLGEGERRGGEGKRGEGMEEERKGGDEKWYCLSVPDRRSRTKINYGTQAPCEY